MYVSYALDNALSLAGFTTAFWGWGTLLSGKMVAVSWRPALGAAAVAIIAPTAYYCGVAPGSTGVFVFAVGAMGVLLGLWRARTQSSSPPASLIFGAVVVALLLWLPLAIGGAQFGIFHSNPYDELCYLSSSATTINETHTTVAGTGPAAMLRDPLIANTRFWMGLRYGVVDLYAIWAGVAPVAIPTSSGGCLAAFLLALYFATAGLLTIVLGRYQPSVAVIAGSLVAGYWGQLQLDLNSWGWVMASPLLVAELGLLAEMFGEAAQDSSRTWRGRAVALGVISAGFSHLYFEMGVFFIPAVVAGALATHVIRRRVASDLRTLGLALGVTLLLLLPGARLLATSMSTQWAWAHAMDASVLKWVWQSVIAPGSSATDSGMYPLRWLGLVGGAGWAPQAGLRLVGDIVTLLAMAIAAGIAIRQGRRRPELIFIGVSIAAIATMTLTLLALGHRWLAFKAVSYVAVVAWPLLALTVARRRGIWPKLPAGGLIAASLGLAFLRLEAARSGDGLYYRGYGYVAPLDPVLKQARWWDLPDLGAALGKAKAVKIDVPDVWLELYAMLIADAQRVPFFKTTPVTDLWHFSGRDLGRQQEIPGYDALIYLEYDFARHRAALAFARRDGTIFSPQRRARVIRIEAGSTLDTRGGLLAWPMQPTPGFNTSRVVVECGEAGDYALTLSVMAPPQLQGRTRLLIRGATSSPPAVAIGSQKPGTMQGVTVPLTLNRGRNSVTITLQSLPDSALADVGLWLANPRMEQASVRR